MSESVRFRIRINTILADDHFGNSLPFMRCAFLTHPLALLISFDPSRPPPGLRADMCPNQYVFIPIPKKVLEAGRFGISASVHAHVHPSNVFMLVSQCRRLPSPNFCPTVCVFDAPTCPPDFVRPFPPPPGLRADICPNQYVFVPNP